MGKAILAARLKRNPKPVRRVRSNAAPFVTPLLEGESFANLHHEMLMARAEAIQSNKELCEQLLQLSAREPSVPSDHVEEQIFDGFPSYGDKALMAKFHATEWCDRFAVVEQFEDQRYRCLGRRLIYGHCPESLPGTVRQEEAALLRARLTGEGHDNPPWTTLAAADAEAAEMEKERNPEHADMLSSFRAHVTSSLSRLLSAN